MVNDDVRRREIVAESTGTIGINVLVGGRALKRGKVRGCRVIDSQPNTPLAGHLMGSRIAINKEGNKR